MTRDSKQKHYDVGYRKPPKNSRFAKGQSGNPSGKKTMKNVKPQASLKQLLSEELQKEIQVKEAGKTTTVTKAAALARLLVNKILSGDTASHRTLINLLMNIVPPSDENLLTFRVSDEQQKIVDAFLADDDDYDDESGRSRSRGRERR